MVSFRTKLWFVASGVNVGMALICAMAHALHLLVFTVVLAFYMWWAGNWSADLDYEVPNEDDGRGDD